MRRSAMITLCGLAALAAVGCTHGSHYNRSGDRHYSGGEWDGARDLHDGPLHGPGLDLLDPWLKETREGRAIVTLGFRDAARGFVDEDVAHRANIWFRRYADGNRDMRVTDPEIRTALVAAAGPYMR